MKKSVLGLVFLSLVITIWSNSSELFKEKTLAVRTPSSAGRNIGNWFRDRFALFNNRIQFEAKCLSGCEAKRKGKVLEGNIREGQVFEIEIITKNVYSGLEVKALYPEIVDLKLLEQKNDKAFKYSVSFKKGKYPRSANGRVVNVREQLMLVRPVNSRSGHHLIAQRDIKLRFSLEQLNTPPVFDLPASVEVTGAVTKATIPLKVTDAEGDTIFVECEGLGRVNGQISIAQSTICSARDGHRGGQGVLTTNHRIEVIRNNTAPDIALSGRVTVAKNQLMFSIPLVDQENDPVSTTCFILQNGQYSSMNLCQGNLLNLQELPLGEEVTIRITATDRHLNQTKDITFVRVEKKNVEFVLTLPPGISYTGSIAENFAELGFDESNILENNLPGYENGEFQVSGETTGEFELLAKRELEEVSVRVKVLRKSIEQLEKVSLELAQDGVRGRQNIEVSLPGMGALCPSEDCFKVFNSDLGNATNDSISPLKNLIYSDGKVMGDIEWSLVDSPINQNFILIASSGQQVKSFLLELDYHFEGPKFNFKGNSQFDVGQPKEVELEIGLGTIPDTIKEVRLENIESDFIIFNTNYDRTNKKLTLGTGQNKLFLLAKNSEGNKRKVVSLVTQSGDSYSAVLNFEIKKPEESYVKIRVYNLVNSLGQAAFTPERLVQNFSETYRMFKGQLGVQVLEYKTVKKPDHNGTFTDGNEEDDDYIKLLVDADKKSLPILLSERLISDSGTQVGGLAPLPSYASQDHYALVSRSGDEGTITHELGHNFGLEHTFDTRSNPIVGLCNETQGRDGLKYCRFRGQQGNLVLPNGQDPIRANAPLIGDGVSDTPVDADKTTYFTGACYGVRFNGDGYTRQFHCPENGVALANIETESLSYSVVNVAGEDTCKFQWSDRSVKCKGNYPSDPSSPSLKKNIMSYWPHSAATEFTSGQLQLMKEKFDRRNLKIKDFLAD